MGATLSRSEYGGYSCATLVLRLQSLWSDLPCFWRTSRSSTPTIAAESASRAISKSLWYGLRFFCAPIVARHKTIAAESASQTSLMIAATSYITELQACNKALNGNLASAQRTAAEQQQKLRRLAAETTSTTASRRLENVSRIGYRSHVVLDGQDRRHQPAVETRTGSSALA